MISVSILAPLLTALVIFMLRDGVKGSVAAKRNAALAVVATLVSFVSAIVMQRRFAANYAESQLREVLWTSGGSGINLSFAVDGISMPLFLTACLLFFVAALFSLNAMRLQQSAATGEGTRIFWSMFLLLDAIVLGIFSAYNFIVFFALWELFLIPLVILLWRYGLEERQKAAINFFIYTFASSAFMIAAFVAIVYHVPRVGGDLTLNRYLIPKWPTCPRTNSDCYSCSL